MVRYNSNIKDLEIKCYNLDRSLFDKAVHCRIIRAAHGLYIS